MERVDHAVGGRAGNFFWVILGKNNLKKGYNLLQFSCFVFIHFATTPPNGTMTTQNSTHPHFTDSALKLKQSESLMDGPKAMLAEFEKVQWQGDGARRNPLQNWWALWRVFATGVVHFLPHYSFQLHVTSRDCSFLNSPSKGL